MGSRQCRNHVHAVITYGKASHDIDDETPMNRTSRKGRLIVQQLMRRGLFPTLTLGAMLFLALGSDVELALANNDGVIPPSGSSAFTNCHSLKVRELLERAQGLPRPAVRFSTRILPGGATTPLVIDQAFHSQARPLICGAVIPYKKVPSPQELETFRVTGGKDNKTTQVLIAMPPVASEHYFWEEHVRIVVAGFTPLKTDPGQWRLGFAIDERKRTSDFMSAMVTSVIFALALYVGTALAWARSHKGNVGFRIFDPVVLTAGTTGRASLSKLQVFFFSFIMAGLVLYFYLRTGALPALSQDILLLLGISAGGTLGAKVAAVGRRRLSTDNWSWLKRQQWFKTSELPVPQWRQLLESDGEFDPYKFQMGAFSLIVGLSLVTMGLTDFATFEIPEGLLGILGLSQVVYVAGKIVRPSIKELNDSLIELRRLEDDFVQKVRANWGETPPTPPAVKDLSDAKTKEPTAYDEYKELAKKAAITFESFFNVPVDNDLLEPRLPT